MGDENVNQPDGSAPDTNADPIQNIKGEMNRKLGNVQEQLQKNNEALQALMNRLAAQDRPAPKAPAPESKTSKIKELWYQDEEAAANLIVEDAVQKAEARITQKLESDRKITQRESRVLNEIFQDYPEIGDQNSALYKKAVETYNALPEEDRANPLAYKVAVRDAAIDLGVQPMKKRQASGNNDDFTMSSGGYSSQGTSGRARKSDDLPPETLLFAQAVGLNVSDKKTLENLKSHSKREWLKYKG